MACTKPLRDLPRDCRAVDLSVVPSNAGDSRGLWVEVTNLPEAYRRNRVRVSVTFSMSGDPTVGTPKLYVGRYGKAIDSQSYDARVSKSSGKTLATLADIKEDFADASTTTGTTELEGFDAVYLSNTMDTDMQKITIEFEVIAQPTVEVSP